MKVFKDKVAIITGAASGIGSAIAERCAYEGMKVVLADIDEGALRNTEKVIKSIGVETLSVRCDVSKENDIRVLAEKTLEAFGEVCLLFNNAGVATGTLLWENTTADWQWVLGVNLWGLINSTKTFVPIMLKQNKECHIVNVASIAGFTACPGNGIYSVSKHAIVNFSETLYYEMKLANAPIDVSVVCPGFVNTQLMNSERNRPSDLMNSLDSTSYGPQKQMFEKIFHDGVLSGISPEQVVEEIFQAIPNKKFYILTHKESKDLIRKRMEDILNENNPTIYF
ncbi:SDR family NAD(P)-dependent oxidoreductase [Clostridium cellulovorans]|uniref:Short-chain dehydrogenase/reductase SDR n=1 Tax=Clostridium cellulovorans (strain ATCC 35296 / DSM 3052 / OCM 3 / 743B) TaxID=573061 RepID=D9SQG2_CLOC7|nr:SDR family NAD(P)-dependent oxidoreductase [Clostridium cellulovorans]ADL50229.1 short-chain dehydrogenase/reductase SDR [Clostridium cellulovorans 743B]